MAQGSQEKSQQKDAVADDRDKNVFSQDEFEKIEKKEEGVLSKVFKKKNREASVDSVKDKDKLEAVDINSKNMGLMFAKLQKQVDDVKIFQEKQSAKVEMSSQKEAETNDRLAMLSEQIGELRSTVMARERLIDKMESSITLTKEVVNDIRPDHYKKLIEMKEKEIVKNTSKIDLLEANLKKTSSELAKYKKIMTRIKNFENLIELLENIDKKVKQIEKKNVDVERMAGKVESMFFELNKSLKMINQHDGMISDNTQSLKDMVKDLDKLALKFDGLIKKKDFDGLKKQFELVKAEIVKKDMNSYYESQKNNNVSEDEETDLDQQEEVLVEKKVGKAPVNTANKKDNTATRTKLRDYVLRNLKKGVALGNIKKKLLSVGWSKKLVESVTKDVSRK